MRIGKYFYVPSKEDPCIRVDENRMEDSYIVKVVFGKGYDTIIFRNGVGLMLKGNIAPNDSSNKKLRFLSLYDNDDIKKLIKGATRFIASYIDDNLNLENANKILVELKQISELELILYKERILVRS